MIDLHRFHEYERQKRQGGEDEASNRTVDSASRGGQGKGGAEAEAEGEGEGKGAGGLSPRKRKPRGQIARGTDNDAQLARVVALAGGARAGI